MEPVEIAARLREIAIYRELEGEAYRARAYERAAQTVAQAHDLQRLVDEKRLTELPGVGASIASVITELAAGENAMLDQLRVQWPQVIVELSQLPAVGPQRARKIHDALAPASLDELAAMCEAGRVRELPGFGKVSEQRVLEAIRGRSARAAADVALTLLDARDRSDGLAAHLRACPASRRVEIAGAARRWVEICERLGFAVATERPQELYDHLARHPLIVSVTPQSPDGVAVRHAVARFADGVTVDLHTAPPERFGVASVLATGAEAHVEQLRALAGERGVVLEGLLGADEAAIYRALGLPAFPAEVRDGTDEIAAALAGDRFADLITLADITGAVHCHTVYSDGKHSVEQMARAAEARGLRFLTVTDHSQSAHYASGLGPDQLRLQWREIADVQERVGCRLLRGTESDILADGGLDYPIELLGELDVVIASLHQRHKLDEDATTRRLVAAMRAPVFKIWGHALGRLIMHREPVPCRFDEVLDAIVDAGNAAIEINGDPRRLDLDPVRARKAKARGIRFVLSSDAHSTRQLDNLDYAVAMARRARLRKSDVLNALPADEFAQAVRPLPEPARRAG